MALVITRRSNETVQIGPDVYVTVKLIQGNRVRLEIQAPPDIRIWRTELTERQRKELAP